MGAKGVLKVDPTLPGLQIQLRKSMIKFNASNRSLDIIRCSTFSNAFLNRQVILILNAMGVKEETLLTFQEEYKNSIDPDRQS